MPEETPDVDAASSTANDVVDDVPPQGDVASDVVVDDRPMRNWQAENDRKFGRLEEMIVGLAANLNTIATHSTQSAATVPVTSEPTDDELAQRAALGDANALMALQDRRINKVVDQRDSVARLGALVDSQMLSLVGKYPGVRDTGHPFRGAVLQAKSVLLGIGYADNKATDVEAMKLAIANDPDLARSAMAPNAPAPAAPIRDNVPGPANLGGPAPRRRPQAAPAALVDDKTFEMARRMNPQKYATREAAAAAVARFRKRNAEGKTGFTPNVGIILKEQGDA